jgi:hypothetical protein
LIVYGLNNGLGVNIYDKTIHQLGIAEVNISATGGGIAHRNADDFQLTIENSLTLSLNDKTMLALDLYNLSYNESTDRAKFLTYITIFELLSDGKKKAYSIQSYIDKLECIVDSNLEEKIITIEVGKDVKAGLGRLREVSIQEKASELIKEYIEGDAHYNNLKANVFFKKCYGKRSGMLHQGSMKVPTEMIDELKRLTRDLLLSILNKTTKRYIS